MGHTNFSNTWLCSYRHVVFEKIVMNLPPNILHKYIVSHKHWYGFISNCRDNNRESLEEWISTSGENLNFSIRQSLILTRWHLTNFDLPPGPIFTKRCCLIMGIGIPIINLRPFDDHLRFIMGIPIESDGVFLVNTGPGAKSKLVNIIWFAPNILWVIAAFNSFRPRQKWTPFRRQHIQLHFLEKFFLNSG